MIFKLDSYCERVNFQWSGAHFAGWSKQETDYQIKFLNSFRISLKSLTLAAGRPNSVKDSLEFSNKCHATQICTKIQPGHRLAPLAFYIKLYLTRNSGIKNRAKSRSRCGATDLSFSPVPCVSASHSPAFPVSLS